MKKLLAIIAVLVLAMALLAGCGSEKPKKFVVGLDDQFPPMGFKDEKGAIVGFDIDIAREAAKRLKWEVEFKPIDWSAKEVELKSKRIDAIWNGFNIFPEREKVMLFSDPYMKCAQITFTMADKTIKDGRDLAGKVVGVQQSSTAEKNIKADPTLSKSIKELRVYPDVIACLMDLKAGRLDAVVTDDIAGLYYTKKDGQEKYKVYQEPIGPVGNFGIGFRLEDKATRDAVQKVLNEMAKDGTTAKISDKWFGRNIWNTGK